MACGLLPHNAVVHGPTQQESIKWILVAEVRSKYNSNASNLNSWLGLVEVCYMSQRDPAVSHGLLCHMPFMHKVEYAANGIPAPTIWDLIYRTLWHIRPCDTAGMVHQENVTVTQNPLCTKSCMLWHIGTVTKGMLHLQGMIHKGRTPAKCMRYRPCLL